MHGLLSSLLLSLLMATLILSMSSIGTSLSDLIMLNLSLIGIVILYGSVIQGYELDADRYVASRGRGRDLLRALVKAAWNTILGEYLFYKRFARLQIKRTHPLTLIRLIKLAQYLR